MAAAQSTNQKCCSRHKRYNRAKLVIFKHPIGFLLCQTHATLTASKAALKLTAKGKTDSALSDRTCLAKSGGRQDCCFRRHRKYEEQHCKTNSVKKPDDTG